MFFKKKNFQGNFIHIFFANVNYCNVFDQSFSVLSFFIQCLLLMKITCFMITVLLFPNENAVVDDTI